MSERRPVPGYEGLYEVTDTGEIYSIARIVDRKNGIPMAVKPRKLRLTGDGRGYICASLSRDGVGATKRVSRIVCRAFHGEPSAGDEAAHLDGNPQNNAATNLKWCSKLENAGHRKIHGTEICGSDVNTAKIDADKARQIVLRNMAGESQTALAREYGLDQSAVSLIVNGKTWVVETAVIRAPAGGQA